MILLLPARSAQSACLWRVAGLEKNSPWSICLVYLVDVCEFVMDVEWISMPGFNVWVIEAAEPDPIQVGHCDGGETTLRPLT
jgi:hypothetical protein